MVQPVTRTLVFWTIKRMQPRDKKEPDTSYIGMFCNCSTWSDGHCLILGADIHIQMPYLQGAAQETFHLQLLAQVSSINTAHTCSEPPQRP